MPSHRPTDIAIVDLKMACPLTERNQLVNIQFGMMVIYARDLDKSIEFYRLLGLDISEPDPDRPVAMARMRSGVTLIFTTDELAIRFDAGWVRPASDGYQQVMEFVVSDDRDIDSLWATLTSAGYRGRTAPDYINGPYAAVVEDPDGNVILISADLATLTGAST